MNEPNILVMEMVDYEFESLGNGIIGTDLASSSRKSLNLMTSRKSLIQTYASTKASNEGYLNPISISSPLAIQEVDESFKGWKLVLTIEHSEEARGNEVVGKILQPSIVKNVSKMNGNDLYNNNSNQIQNYYFTLFFAFLGGGITFLCIYLFFSARRSNSKRHNGNSRHGTSPSRLIITSEALIPCDIPIALENIESKNIAINCLENLEQWLTELSDREISLSMKSEEHSFSYELCKTCKKYSCNCLNISPIENKYTDTNIINKESSNFTFNSDNFCADDSQEYFPNAFLDDACTQQIAKGNILGDTGVVPNSQFHHKEIVGYNKYAHGDSPDTDSSFLLHTELSRLRLNTGTTTASGMKDNENSEYKNNTTDLFSAMYNQTQNFTDGSEEISVPLDSSSMFTSVEDCNISSHENFKNPRTSNSTVKPKVPTTLSISDTSSSVDEFPSVISFKSPRSPSPFGLGIQRPLSSGHQLKILEFENNLKMKSTLNTSYEKPIELSPNNKKRFVSPKRIVKSSHNQIQPIDISKKFENISPICSADSGEIQYQSPGSDKEQFLLENLYVSDCDNFDIINDLSAIFPIDMKTNNDSNKQCATLSANDIREGGGVNGVQPISLELPPESSVNTYEFRYANNSNKRGEMNMNASKQRPNYETLTEKLMQGREWKSVIAKESAPGNLNSSLECVRSPKGKSKSDIFSKDTRQRSKNGGASMGNSFPMISLYPPDSDNNKNF